MIMRMGRTVWMVAAACVGALALTSRADAAVLHTPPLASGASGMRCEIKNIGSAPAEVTIQIVLTGGTFHVNSRTATIRTDQSAVVVGIGSTSVCRFTVPGSHRAALKNFLASACVLTPNGCGGALAAQ